MHALEPSHRLWFKPRFSVRWLIVATVLAAVASFLLVRVFEEQLRKGIRYTQVMVFQRGDLARHTDPSAHTSLAREFIDDVRAGKIDAARSLTTSSFRRRIDPSQFEASLQASSLVRGPCHLVEAITEFSDREQRLITRYRIECQPLDGEVTPQVVRCVVVSEASQLKINAVEVIP